MTEENKFNLVLVHEKFSESLHEEDDVKLKQYLDSFEELNKFFLLMGTLFGFVSKDLREKMDILYQLLNESAENFETVKKMINYEKENNLLNKSGYTSGSRTLLRLHRGLEFIKLFLQKIEEIDDETATSQICKQAYAETLSKHHSFLIRKAAGLAMYTMPTRGQLLINVCGEPEEIKKALEVLPQTLAVTDVVYNRIHNIYTENALHSLP